MDKKPILSLDREKLTPNQRLVQQMQAPAQVWPMAKIDHRSEFRRMQYTKDELRHAVMQDLAQLREMSLNETEHAELVAMFHTLKRHIAAENVRLRLLPN